MVNIYDKLLHTIGVRKYESDELLRDITNNDLEAAKLVRTSEIKTFSLENFKNEENEQIVQIQSESALTEEFDLGNWVNEFDQNNETTTYRGLDAKLYWFVEMGAGGSIIAPDEWISERSDTLTTGDKALVIITQLYNKVSYSIIKDTSGVIEMLYQSGSVDVNVLKDISGNNNDIPLLKSNCLTFAKAYNNNIDLGDKFATNNPYIRFIGRCTDVTNTSWIIERRSNSTTEKEYQFALILNKFDFTIFDNSTTQYQLSSTYSINTSDYYEAICYFDRSNELMTLSVRNLTNPNGWNTDTLHCPNTVRLSGATNANIGDYWGMDGTYAYNGQMCLIEVRDYLLDKDIAYIPFITGYGDKVVNEISGDIYTFDGTLNNQWGIKQNVFNGNATNGASLFVDDVDAPSIKAYVPFKEIVTYTPNSGYDEVIVVAGQSIAVGYNLGELPDYNLQGEFDFNIIGYKELYSTFPQLDLSTFEKLDYPTNNLGEVAGVELWIAKCFNGKNVYLIKVGLSGSDLVTEWNDGSVLRNKLIEKLTYANANLQNPRYTLFWSNWHQSARFQTSYNVYADTFLNDFLPALEQVVTFSSIILEKVNLYSYRYITDPIGTVEMLNQQNLIVAGDVRAKLLDIDDLPFAPDGYHYYNWGYNMIMQKMIDDYLIDEMSLVSEITRQPILTEGDIFDTLIWYADMPTHENGINNCETKLNLDQFFEGVEWSYGDADPSGDLTFSYDAITDSNERVIGVENIEITQLI